MNILEITQQLQHLIAQKFYIPQQVIESNLSQPLIGDALNFDSIKMVYLFFEIMQMFDFCFEPQDLSNYKFSSIKNIAALIHSHLSAQ